jgi:sorting nexin-29
LFIDFEAAYDSIEREQLFKAMEEFEIPRKMIGLTKAILKNVKCRVKIQNQLSGTFATQKGLRQGDALSCLLFNIALEKVIRESGIDTRGTVFHKSTQLLAYADDVDIIGRTERAVSEAFIKLEEAAKRMGLIINQDKTKYLAAVNTTSRRDFIIINSYKFECVTGFKYLGTIITNDNNITTEINSRIQMANKSYYGSKKQLQSLFLSRKTKCKLYISLFRPVLTYGSESWTLNKANIEKLMTFEKNVLRKIYGTVNDKGIWRIRYNTEI